jgi:NAD(P)H-hydrate epimerase
MPLPYLLRSEVRELDRRAIEEFGVPGVVLMENAGRGTVELLLRLGVSGPVAVCCGKGNNGGDGFVIARHLDNHGMPVRVLLFVRPEEIAGDAAVNYEILRRSEVPVVNQPESIGEAEWIVDALLGTGLSGTVRPPFAEAIEAINSHGARVLAVDIPSGLDCDSGQPLGVPVRADHTATFVAEKAGFALPGASAWLGKVHVVDIGAPRVLIEQFSRA